VNLVFVICVVCVCALDFGSFVVFEGFGVFNVI